MSSAVQLALAVGPLALYLYLVALWHSGRRPRVILGVVDYALLVVAIGGLVLFGPLGWLLLDRLGMRAPGLMHWLALGSALGLLAVPGLPRGFRRLVIYNVDPEVFERVLAETLAALPGRFEKTLRGFEDAAHEHALELDVQPFSRMVVLEAHGPNAELLVRALRPALRARLTEPAARPSPVAWGLLAASAALVLPVLIVAFSRPQTRAALRGIIRYLSGG